MADILRESAPVISHEGALRSPANPLVRTPAERPVPSSWYGKSPVEEIGFGERNMVLTELQAEAAKNPATVSYTATEHFIVAFKEGVDLIKQFGYWLDTDVSSMANFLEDNLPRVMKHFHLPIPDVTQVVTVKNKSWISRCLPIDRLRNIISKKIDLPHYGNYLEPI